MQPGDIRRFVHASYELDVWVLSLSEPEIDGDVYESGLSIADFESPYVSTLHCAVARMWAFSLEWHKAISSVLEALQAQGPPSDIAEYSPVRIPATNLRSFPARRIEPDAHGVARSILKDITNYFYESLGIRPRDTNEAVKAVNDHAREIEGLSRRIIWDPAEVARLLARMGRERASMIRLDQAVVEEKGEEESEARDVPVDDVERVRQYLLECRREGREPGKPTYVVKAVRINRSLGFAALRVLADEGVYK